MKELLFATTNDEKFAAAKAVLETHGIKVTQLDLDIDEIQGEDSVKIALDKSVKAYQKAGQPVVITDDSWAYHGLGGFPGAYMHAVNEWFSRDIWNKIAKIVTDRSITLTQHLVYYDGTTQKLFTANINGKFIEEPRGDSVHPSLCLAVMDGDDGLTVAEALSTAKKRDERAVAKVWQQFAAWFVTL